MFPLNLKLVCKMLLKGRLLCTGGTPDLYWKSLSNPKGGISPPAVVAVAVFLLRGDIPPSSTEGWGGYPPQCIEIKN